MADFKLNDYTKRPVNAAQYSMMRGVTDFTNAEQLNMFEGGHGMIIIIDRPKFMEKLAEKDPDGVGNLLNNFCNIIEYEFKGLDGIQDIDAEDLVYSDGISEIAGVGKVTEQSNSEVTMSFTEKSGSTITKFIKFYLDGVRDSRTQTKHYHGLIASGEMTMGFENEVFNLLYLVTDASGLALEAAYLLANAWPNSAKTNIYNVEKGAIDPKTVDVTFKCFVLRSEEVDKRAVKMLAYVNQDNAVANATGALGSSSKAAALAEEITSYDPNQINWDSQKNQYKGLSKISKAYGGNEDASTGTTFLAGLFNN